ncbi:MAG: hypothetical protein KJ667_02570 [Alphaproteobacteria bacterium]|nr:hypothetical protein [Alphaproteobacteria bacterium]
MCKFHKDVARAVATHPVTNEFDAGRYAIGLLAMASFRIEQYMPAMHGVDGFVPAQMATPEAQESFAASGLQKPAKDIESYRISHIGTLQRAMDVTGESFDLSLTGLNIPDIITRSGYKHCAKMDPDPTKNGPFMDEAIVELFEGYDDPEKTWATGELTLANTAHKPEYEALRKAAAHFMMQPAVAEILRQMFEDSVAEVFSNAQQDLEAGRGFEETDGCVMCGHGDRAEELAQKKEAATPVVKAEEATPDTSAKPTLSSKFMACARCARDGAGGAALSHVGCILTPIAAGAFGFAVSGPLMAGIMLVTAPLIAVGATWGLDRLRGQKASPLKMGASAVIAVGMALAISSLTGGHDHHATTPGGAHDHHNHEQHQQHNHMTTSPKPAL